jgi:Protein of unknown function (DUF1203)
MACSDPPPRIRPARLHPKGTTVTDAATTFRIRAIPQARLERLRVSKFDDFTNRLEVITDESGGAPLRCCLRTAMPGDRIVLIAYRPFDRLGPFAEVGPVFVHAEPCAGYAYPDRYPEGFRERELVFRPYRFDGWMAYSAIAIADGSRAEKVVEEIFADPAIEMIHTRNVYAGCYMFAIDRPAGDRGVSETSPKTSP